MIAALWLMIVEGLIAHAVNRAKSRRLETALMRNHARRFIVARRENNYGC